MYATRLIIVDHQSRTIQTNNLFDYSTLVLKQTIYSTSVH